MSIEQEILAALSTVLPNTWAVELPPNPSWPAIVFNVETERESQWPAGQGYLQHTVTVVVMSRQLGQIKGDSGLQAQIDAAMHTLETYLEEGAAGDADYQADSSVYAYYSIHVIRKRI